jgi:type II secretory pathway pseudopilin PulG
MASKKKGAILFVVLAVILVVVILSGVILSIISSQSRLTNHQVSRIKAYYASKGIMNYVLEKMRTDPDWAPGTTEKVVCHRNCIDKTATAGLSIPTDSDIPYDIQVTIHIDNQADNADLNGEVTQFDIKTKYTYTP